MHHPRDLFDAARPRRLISPSLIAAAALWALLPSAASAQTVAVSNPNAFVTEGDAGTAGNATFNVTATFGAGFVCGGTCTVNYRADSRTALPGSDFTSTSGTLVFGGGGFHLCSSTQTVTVPFVGDSVAEPDETFALVLSGATGCTIQGASATVSIDNDDPGFSVSDASVVEGNPRFIDGVTLDSYAQLQFTVSLAYPVHGRAVRVNYATADATATAGANAVDYYSASGLLGFDSGVVSRDVLVTVRSEYLSEVDETLSLVLSGNSAGQLLRAAGTGTIINDDPLVGLTIDDGYNQSVQGEGSSGTFPLYFTVWVDTMSGRDVTVDWTTADGTATSPADYLAASGRLTIPAGAYAASVFVNWNGDTRDEPNESFYVNLSNPVGAVLNDTQAVGTIVDDDAPPFVMLGPGFSALEGDTGYTPAYFTVSLSQPSGYDVSGAWYQTDSSAVGTEYPELFPGDYLLSFGQFTIPAGSTSVQVPVSVIGDTIDEGDEGFLFSIAYVTNATPTVSTELCTILDDDPVPVWSIGDARVTEGNNGSTLATFTLSVPNPSASNLTVTWTTAPGTAAAGGDYVTASGTATLVAGQTQATVTVSVTGDALDEADETFFVNLSNPSAGSALGDAQGVATIVDDDALPSLSVGDVRLTEGSAGTLDAVFTVTLSAASGRTVTVDYATANGDATAPADFTSTSGTLSFAAGVTSLTFSVPVAGDTLDEVDETFVVNLSNPANATLADAQGVGTIADDDATPTLAVADVRVTEGNTGTVSAAFVVTLSAASGRTVTVSYSTASGSASAPADFTSASGALSFAPGVTSLTVNVTVAGDTLDEDDEGFTLDLSAPVNATLTDAQGVATIADDDATPSMTIGDVTLTEGNTGSANAVFTVSLSAASGRTITVAYATAAGSAAAGADYTTTSGALSFTAGSTSLTVSVPVLGDALYEATEAFYVDLSGATNVVVTDARGQANITDDDAMPSISVSDVTVTEGNTGTVNGVFTLTLSAASGLDTTVSYATANGTATAPADYTTASGTATFAAGTTALTVSVPLATDALDEADETFFLNLSAPTNATVSDAQGQATIADDDATPSLTVSDVRVTEGNAGTAVAIFTVTLSAASGRTVSFDYATANGTAGSPADYSATSGTLGLAAGATSGSFSVTINADVLDELDETFLVNLTNPVNATLADAQGVGTIADDDATPSLSVSDVSIVEGNSGTATALFTVTLSAASGLTVTADWATAAGTAAAGADYLTASGALSFAPGVTAQTLSVTVYGDTLSEANETFLVNLTNPANATLSDGQGQGTITDDDAQPSLTVTDATVTEGNSGTVTATFNVNLTAASGQTVTVDWATANGTAASGADYVAASGTLSFAPGATARTVTVTVNADTLDEANETFTVNLSNATNAPIIDAQGLGTITDDDASPSVSLAAVSVAEGNTGTAGATFTLTLSAASGQVVTVDWATANGTATSGADYVAASGTASFAAGATSATFTVTVNADVLDEADETFTVNLSNPINVGLATPSATGTITDDDATPTVSVADVTITEGNTGTASAVFTLTLSAASGRTVSVDWATANGTATSPSDYTVGSGTASFAAGATTQTLSVSVAADTLDEQNETFFVNLSNGVNVTIADTQALGTITDDDAPPSLSISDATVTEGNTGTASAVFTVTLSAASGQSVSVDWTTASGTAAAPADYTTSSGTLLFAAGTTSLTLSVPVLGDALDEASETFFVNLSNPVSATVSDTQGLGTITDDDPTPSLTVSDATVTEGSSGTVSAVFTVTLSAASGQTVSVDYATANGTATAPADYNAASGTLSFAAGVTALTISVPVAGDTLDEASETFNLNLSNPVNATVADGVGVGTITDDDAPPTIAITDATVAEGNSGTVTAVFTVTLSAVSGQTVSLDYATANGTAAAPADYTTTSGTLSFAAGVGSRTISVTVAADTLDEANETFNLNLSNPVNATIADGQGLGTITDDDAPPSVSIADVTVAEGNAGTVSAVFTVTLSSASGQAVSLDYATANGTAAAPADYTTASGTLSFAAGTTALTVAVSVAGDALDEVNENFSVNLSNPVNVTIADGQGLGTITDDDAPPSVSIADVAITEGNTGTLGATFNLTLSGASGQPVTVTWTTSDGTATAPTDYLATSGAATFAAGVTSVPVTVTVNADVLDEADETLNVTLSGPTNATILDGLGVGTILDDDALPTVSIGDVTVTEGNAGTATAVFTVSLSAPSGRAVTVDWATAANTAAAGVDYLTGAGTLSFAAGSTAQAVSVVVNADATDEANETFQVNLSNPVNATVADAQGLGTIADDDAPPTVSIGDTTVTEGSTGAVLATFTVTLSAASGQAITVDYATANDRATAPADYTTGAGTLSFAAGVTSRTLTVSVAADALDEVDETFSVNLSNPVNVTVLDGQGVGTVLDDDAPPTVAVGDATVTEGDSGTSVAVFTVTLSAASGQTLSVDWSTAAGSAAAGADYTTGAGTLSFPAGTTSLTVGVTVVADTLDEPDETFELDLANPVNVTVADGRGVATIVDDDATPTLSVGDATVTEGTAATTSAVFTVSLSAPSGQTVTVAYTTAGGTATAGGDYTTTAGTLSFAPGTTAQTLAVPVVADALDEADETFTVTLSAPAGATLADGSGLGTIADDDAPPSIVIANASVVEGNAGAVTAAFVVTLSAASGQAVTVDWATAISSARSPSDFLTGSGTLSFPAGSTTQVVNVTVNGDTTDEINEAFFVNLTNAVNATIGDAQGVGTIVDDDGAPTLSISDVTVAEGSAGNATATFTVTLLPASGRVVTVAWATADQTAAAGSDYVAASGTLSFPGGATARSFTVDVTGDTLDEANEAFVVNLTSPVNATIATAQGTGTIVDDDAAPSVAVADAAVAEGDAGRAATTFTLTLDAPSAQVLSVDWTTAPGSALAGADYAPASGTVTFPPGGTVATVTVDVLGDALDEPDESFSVNLTNGVNLAIADGQATGTIRDDDAPVSLSVADLAVVEGNAGETVATFTVTLSAASGQTVTVGWATADDTALAGVDYAAASGTLGFPPGVTTQSFDVRVLGDTLDEAAERFAVELSAPTNATLGQARALAAITDDDDAPSLSLTDATVTEGTGGAVFYVDLSAPSGQTVTVLWATGDETAAQGSDYVGASGALSFPPGTTRKSFTVDALDDALDEAAETFAVELSAPVNATLGDGRGAGTILDDDAPPSVSVGDVAVVEGSVGNTSARVVVSLSAPSGRTVTVAWATADGTASAPDDYAAASGTLSFAPGTLSQEVAVDVRGDALDEAGEAFVVELSSPTNAFIADGQGTVTIEDDDGAAEIYVADARVTEGDAGEIGAAFEVTLATPSGQTVTVDWATADGSAGRGADYVAAAGTLRFLPGETRQTVYAAVRGDALDEDDEVFHLRLSGAVNAVVIRREATATILDDDAPPALTVADVTATEGTGTNTPVIFAFSLSAPSGRRVTVAWSTQDGSALAGLDYLAAAGTVELLPGITTQTVAVQLLGDALDEADETFELVLGAAQSSTAAAVLATATVSDDDEAPGLAVRDAVVAEGTGGRAAASLTVELSAASGREVSVAYATADGTARDGADYLAAAGVLRFPPGVTRQPLVVEVLGDPLDEADETVVIALGAATNATVTAGRALLTIADDDLPPNLRLSMDGSEPFVVGRAASYTFRVENVGGGPTTGAVALRDRLPVGLAYASSAGEGWSCAEEAGELLCSNGASLPAAGALAPLTVEVTVAPEAFPRVTNTATVSAAGDPVAGDDAVSLSREVTGLADLAVAKTRPDAPVAAGSEVGWTITVTNGGPNAVESLSVFDRLPASVSGPRFAPSAGRYDPTTGLLSDLRLAAGERVELMVTGLLASTATGTLANRAEVGVGPSVVDPEPANDLAVHRSVIADAAACDDDGLADDEERRLGTDPCDPDGDDDGLLDGIEVHGDNPTDPRDPDSDDDGLCDGDRGVGDVCDRGEDLNRNGAVDRTETDPNDPDTDHGGVSDGEELARGSDPLLDTDDPTSRDCQCSAAGRERPAPLGSVGVSMFALCALLGRRLRQR